MKRRPIANLKAPRAGRLRWLSAVELVDTASGSQLPNAPIFSAAGMTAQHVRIDAQGGYDFNWKGRQHYLALHDIRSRESETHTDVQDIDRSKDVRGRLTFIPAGCRAWGWSVPETARQSFTALYFDPEQLEADVEKRLRNIPDRLMLYFTNSALRSTLEHLQASLAQAFAPDVLYLESLCLIAGLQLCLVQQDTGRVRPAGQLAKPQEAKIAEFIEANLARDVCLDDLAKIAGLSRFHFLRAFKRTTQQTPYQYLLQRRIARAEVLLAEKDLLVSEVAAAVGFKDSARFIRTFRRFKGSTPGSYRR